MSIGKVRRKFREEARGIEPRPAWVRVDRRPRRQAVYGFTDRDWRPAGATVVGYDSSSGPSHVGTLRRPAIGGRRYAPADQK